uniref:Gag polyprotein (Fragments) n=1 Tax=Gallus gallus TaxID=9031 RepID=Q7LZ15_CHICK
MDQVIKVLVQFCKDYCGKSAPSRKEIAAVLSLLSQPAMASQKATELKTWGLILGALKAARVEPQGQLARLRPGELIAATEPPTPCTDITQGPNESFQSFTDRLLAAAEGLPRAGRSTLNSSGEVIQYVLDKLKVAGYAAVKYHESGKFLWVPSRKVIPDISDPFGSWLDGLFG